MQIIEVDGQVPTSLEAIKQAVADNPGRVSVIATSVFGNEYDGPLSDMPEGEVACVGPDGEENRDFYFNLISREGRFFVSF